MPLGIVGAKLDAVTPRASSLRHVRPVQPLRFPAAEPEDEKMPESGRHHRLREALFQMLCALSGESHTVGSEQFIYYDASNPKRCLAPDAFVKLGAPAHDFDSYRTWEEGTPELAFEILSPSDSPERWTFAEKLRRYRALGVRELVVLDMEARNDKRLLRAWDRLEHDLVERVVRENKTPCVTLGATILVGRVGKYPIGLRLARDAAATDLVLTEAEARAAAEASRAAAETARVAAESALREAQSRAARLEKQLTAARRKRR